MNKQEQDQQRKSTPIYSGVLAYFPLAISAVAQASQVGNDQHNPNSELHWDRSKSGDEINSLSRHLLDRASGEKFDSDGVRHLSKVAWRALAALQKEIEKDLEEDANSLPHLSQKFKDLTNSVNKIYGRNGEI